MEITLTKALKLKKRIAGELAELSAKLRGNNSYEVGQTPKYNTSDIMTEYQTKMLNLIELKTAIAKANQGILPKILRLAELKQLVLMYRGLDIQEGSKRLHSVQGGATVVMAATIDQKACDNNIKQLLEEIENLQDEIEEYNAITKITA